MLDIVRPDDFYQMSTDVIKGYHSQGAMYLHKMSKKPLSECEKFVRSLPIKDPKVLMNVRDPITQDRSREETTLRQYFRLCTQENLVVAPTLTAYLPASEKRSFLGRFIIKKMKQRGVYKHKMFECQMSGDTLGQQTNKSLQSVSKELNNSASGAQSIPSNPIFNKSAHPTLTSGCRTATSYANRHNEEFLAGNRPYFSYHDAINHILATITMSDRSEIQHAVNSFNLHIPTTEETWKVISYSLNKYGPSSVTTKKVIALIDTLDDIERVAICYNYDLKHLAMFNESLVKDFLLKMSLHTDLKDTDEYTDKFSKASGDIKTMILFQHGFEFKGMKTDSILAVPENKEKLDKAAMSINNTLSWFSPIINAFWLNRCQLQNNAYMDMVRREVVPVSDTDSTVFTNQEWTKFVTGSYNFEELSFRVGNATTYITAKIVSHHLKAMSVNFNIDRKEMTRIKMKNEFYFTVLALTDVAKHYACLKWGVEGNILPELVPEIKGVNMRNSAWPENIRETFTNYLIFLLEKISRGEKLTRKDVIGGPLDVENELIRTMTSGKYSLYNRIPVNNAEAYKKPESSAYASYQLWNQVFGPKYGMAPEPPYIGIKIPVSLNNPTAINNYLETIKDRAFAERLRIYLRERNRKDVNIFTLPEPILASIGVPEELIPILNRDTLLSNVTGGFYLVLGSFGIYPRDQHYSVSLTNLFDEDAILTVPT